MSSTQDYFFLKIELTMHHPLQQILIPIDDQKIKFQDFGPLKSYFQHVFT